MIRFAVINFINTALAASADKVFGVVAPANAPATYATVRNAGGAESGTHAATGTSTTVIEADFEIACYSADDGTRAGEVLAATLADQIKNVLRDFTGRMQDPTSPVISHTVVGVRIVEGSEGYSEEPASFECVFSINVTYLK